MMQILELIEGGALENLKTGFTLNHPGLLYKVHCC